MMSFVFHKYGFWVFIITHVLLPIYELGMFLSYLIHLYAFNPSVVIVLLFCAYLSHLLICWIPIIWHGTLTLYFEPRYGQTNVLVYVGICSLMGSMTVMSIKAIGIAIKLTLEGTSLLSYPRTLFFFTIAVICVITQLNYLNKDLDTFNKTIVYPVYYVSFTMLTIIASAIMFKDWSGQDARSIASEICGFVTILCGTMILHSTREKEQTPTGMYNHDAALAIFT
ncbi:hypothetical protein MKX03_032512 [Papaver bracteatum]|nr:hypothetical protein MKX03_032512 [Papaver bracteatum]